MNGGCALMKEMRESSLILLSCSVIEREELTVSEDLALIRSADAIILDLASRTVRNKFQLYISPLV